jgi:hypothetical protein
MLGEDSKLDVGNTRIVETIIQEYCKTAIPYRPFPTSLEGVIIFAFGPVLIFSETVSFVLTPLTIDH